MQENILKECKGNKIIAAKLLGIHRNIRTRKLKKYDLIVNNVKT